MQNFNYHTHTYRCRHATGDENDYIEEAIKNGFKHIGFSEHCAFSDWECSKGRLQVDEMDRYYNDIESAKEKYKDQITIYTGLEAEYFPELLNYYKELKEKYDYMIVGQHSLDRRGRNIDRVCSDEDLKLYCKYICEAIETGVADYVAHVDYFMLGRDNYNDLCRDVVKEICTCAKAYDVPVELNLKGASYGVKQYENYESFIYPHIKSFEPIAEVRPNIVIGYDAHNPKVLGERAIEEKVREIVKCFGMENPAEEMIIKKR